MTTYTILYDEDGVYPTPEPIFYTLKKAYRYMRVLMNNPDVSFVSIFSSQPADYCLNGHFVSEYHREEITQ